MTKLRKGRERSSEGVVLTRRSVLHLLLVLATVLPLSGCLLAAAGAGAGGAIYVTTRGAESLVERSPGDVAQGVRRAFADLGIRETKRTVEEGGSDQEFEGERGDMKVSVDIERQSSGSTRVEVTAREDVAEFDKDYAKRVLEQILKRT